MQPGTIVTYTKKEFVGQIDYRIRKICTRLDVEAANAQAQGIRDVFAAAKADPKWFEIMVEVEALVGDLFTGADYHVDRKDPQHWVSERSYYGGMGVVQLELQPFVWEIGGDLRALLFRHGFPASKPDPIALPSALIEDELLYLSGAFGTTRAKFWDMLFPPTKAFVEAIKEKVTIEELRQAILAYSEALR